MPKPRVSVVVVNYRADALVAQWRKRFRHSSLCELIVVDHSAGTAGYGAGCNTGVQQAQAPIVVCANPDVDVTPEQALQLAQHLDEHPGVGLVGPQLKDQDGHVQITCSAIPGPWMALLEYSFLRRLPLLSWWSRAYRLFGFDHLSSREVPSVSGSCFAMRTHEYRQIGGADERYFLYFEEFDFALRVQHILHKSVWFTMQVSVSHIGQVSTRQRRDTTPIFRASRQHYLTKWYGWRGQLVHSFLTFTEGQA